MKILINITILGVFLVGCKNNTVHKHGHNHDKNHHSNHILLDSIPLGNISSDTIIYKKIIFNNDTFLFENSMIGDLKSINLELDKYGLTESNILFRLDNIKKISYKGNYGCINNFVFMDTLKTHSCDNRFVYVILDKIAFHISDSHIRTGEVHYWKMTKNEYNSTKKMITDLHYNDWIVNLKMENAPTGGLCDNIKVFNFNDVDTLLVKYNN